MKQYFTLWLCFLPLLFLKAQNNPQLSWGATKYVEDVDTKGPQIRVDKWQNVFMLTTQSEQNPFLGYYLVKYDVTGKELWTKYLAKPLGNIFGGFTLDTLGNAYVGCAYGGTLPGAKGDDAIVVKYAPDGTEQWIQNLSLNYAGHAQIENLKADTMGRLFGVGATISQEQAVDNLLFVIGVDAEDGRQLWRFEQQGFFTAHNLRLLEDRMVIFVTEYRTEGRYYRIIQMDFMGNILSDFSKPYVTGYRLDFNFISQNGDVILGNRGGGYNVTRLNAKGDTLWYYSLPGTTGCSVTAITEDDSLSCYASGAWTDGTAPSKLTTSKISLKGDLLWDSYYRYASDTFSRSFGIAIDKKYVYTIGSVGLLDIDVFNLHIMVYDKYLGKTLYDIQAQKDSLASGREIIPAPNGVFFTGITDGRIDNTTSILTGHYSLPVTTVYTAPVFKNVTIRCLPNPAHNQTLLYYNAPEATITQIFFHDIQGRLLDIMDYRLVQGLNVIHLQNLDRLPEGVINISVNDNTGGQSVRMLKQ